MCIFILVIIEKTPFLGAEEKKSLIGEIRLNNKKYKAMKTKTILIQICISQS